MKQLKLPKWKGRKDPTGEKREEKASLRLARFIIKRKGWIEAVFLRAVC